MTGSACAGRYGPSCWGLAPELTEAGAGPLLGPKGHGDERGPLQRSGIAKKEKEKKEKRKDKKRREDGFNQPSSFSEIF